MDNYINLEAAVDAVTNVYYNTPDIDLSEYKLEMSLRRIPAADVVPVVHGHFVHDGPRFAGGVDWWHCSRCGRLVTDVERNRFDYCPWCGARMDGNENG